MAYTLVGAGLGGFAGAALGGLLGGFPGAVIGGLAGFAAGSVAGAGADILAMRRYVVYPVPVYVPVVYYAYGPSAYPPSRWAAWPSYPAYPPYPVMFMGGP